MIEPKQRLSVCYAQQADQARQESLSYEQFFWEVLQREREVRWQNRTVRLLRQSRLPLDKSLQTLKRKRLPTTVQAHVDVLLEGSFLDRAENVLALVTLRSGKTHSCQCPVQG